MKNIDSLLNESLKELGLHNQLLRPMERITIVEYFTKMSPSMSHEDLSEACHTLLESDICYITIEEAGQAAQNTAKILGRGMTAMSSIGDRIRSAAQGNRATGNQQLAPTTGVTKPIQQAQDFFNTKGSTIRNSPMIRVTDPKGQLSKYFVFPDLDLSRPGHDKVFQAVVSKEESEGNKVENIPINHEARLAAQKAGNYTNISLHRDKNDNRKNEIITALDNADKLISTERNKFRNYSYATSDELRALQQNVTNTFGTLTHTLDQAAKSDPMNNPEQVAKTLETQVDAAQAPEAANPSLVDKALGYMNQVAGNFAGNTQQQAIQTPETTIPGQPTPAGTEAAPLTVTPPAQGAQSAPAEITPNSTGSALPPPQVNAPAEPSGAVNYSTAPSAEGQPVSVNPAELGVQDSGIGSHSRPQATIKLPKAGQAQYTVGKNNSLGIQDKGLPSHTRVQ